LNSLIQRLKKNGGKSGAKATPECGMIIAGCGEPLQNIQETGLGMEQSADPLPSNSDTSYARIIPLPKPSEFSATRQQKQDLTHLN
jgi:hypothetical protein